MSSLVDLETQKWWEKIQFQNLKFPHENQNTLEKGKSYLTTVALSLRP
jgi:hypothetical protein